MKNSLYNAALFLMMLVFAYLQYVLWFREDGLLSYFHLKRALSQQLQKNEKLKERNERLLQQVERLKKDPEAAEGRARGELGMVKKGEVFYQIIH